MVYLELFWAFLKIGFTSFGGMSMVPQINAEMIGHGWMTPIEVLDIVAIAEMTPGPLGMNCATFSGTRVAGMLGALAANLGVMAPTLIVTAIVAVLFRKFKDSKVMGYILYGIRPVCVGMIASVAISLGRTNYFLDGMLNWKGIAIGIVMLTALLKFKRSIPQVIIASAVLGLLLF